MRYNLLNVTLAYTSAINKIFLVKNVRSSYNN